MESTAAQSPYELLLQAASIIPISHYLLGFFSILIVFLYNFLEIHILRDLFSGLRGQPVVLTFDPCSQLYRDVVSKCKTLHGRYLSTPWLSSPHLQTAFLYYFGNSPVVNYRRQIFMTSDGGTLALDWVKNANAKKQDYHVNDAVQQDDKNPLIIVVPGLTSDSNSPYINHLAFNMAKHGWNVVVSNHRGLGGVPITSDNFYNGGWTEDVRKVIDHLHRQYPEAPLFVVGTSIGANILVKYLGEDGVKAPIIGAAAICSPWDLLICDRFMNRRLVQRLYNKALTIGLKDYAQSHAAVLSRLSNWEGVKKARSVRDFDDCATRVVGNYETVDTYYRRCSASNFIGGVTVPLLCISSLDDPVCTSEAIPWDECRLNTNVVLATTQHGGHLPFFEGIAAKSVWWVRAVDEFFVALQSSPLRKKEKEVVFISSANPLESSIDQAPYVHVSEDGMVSAVNNELAAQQEEENVHQSKTNDEELDQENKNTNMILNQPQATARPLENDLVAPVKKCLNQLSRQNRNSLWLLAYIAIITTWPVVGSALKFFFRKKLKNFSSRTSVKS
ncbi:alpha/beta hydrolase domain containing protein 1 [Striga asiatica]|uniref:Alpha/beta hydrolase domain containing protein 1 n=1 Tax=Striga asiatica TaxID=4170 RepID=A0A5A7RED8_STRAF|nr:alpha/beta hydrolase domain containing protein 1 [Striga asiatica]